MACSGLTDQNIIIHTGDDARLVVNFVDCDGAPVRVTGSTLTYTIHVNAEQAALLTKSTPVNVVISSDGYSASLALSSAETAYIEKSYFHKLLVIDKSSHRLTVFSGQITFSLSRLTDCCALTAMLNTDLYVASGAGSSFMLVFSLAVNARNFRIFMMR